MVKIIGFIVSISSLYLGERAAAQFMDNLRLMHQSQAVCLAGFVVVSCVVLMFSLRVLRSALRAAT